MINYIIDFFIRRKYQKNIVYFIFSNNNIEKLFSHYDLKNKNNYFYKIFKKYIVDYDFYSAKKFLIIHRNVKKLNVVDFNELLFNVKKFSLVKKPFNLVISIKLSMFQDQYNNFKKWFFNQFNSELLKTKKNINIYIYITDIEELNIIKIFKKYESNFFIDPIKLSNLDDFTDLDQIRIQFSKKYQRIIKKISALVLLMYCKTTESDRSIMILPSVLTVLGSRIDHFISDFFEIISNKNFHLKNISFKNSSLIYLNTYPGRLYRIYLWVIKKNKFIIVWIACLIILIFSVELIIDYIQIKNISNRIYTNLKLDKILNIQKNPFNFLYFIDTLNDLSYVSVVKFSYARLKFMHSIEYLKNDYIKIFLSKYIKKLFENALINNNISIGDRYILFCAYLKLGYNINYKFSNNFISNIPPILKNVLIYWEKYNLPKIILNKKIVKHHLNIFKGITSETLFFSIFKFYKNKNKIYTIEYYNKFFNKKLNDFIKMINAFSQIQLKNIFLNQKIKEQNNFIRIKYLNKYFQYWLEKVDQFKLKTQNSFLSYINEFKQLTKNNSSIEKKLSAIYKNTYPLIENDHMPDSLKQMDLWINKKSNIKMLKKNMIFIQTDLEKILKNPNKNQILLKAYKNYIKDKKLNNFIGLIKKLDKDAPPLWNKIIKTFDDHLFQLIVQEVFHEIDTQWNQILVFYQKNIENYYPVNPLGKDVSISVFLKFFGQKGIFLKFFNQTIAPFLSDFPAERSPDYLKKKLDQLNPLLNKWLYIAKKFSKFDQNKGLIYTIQPIWLSQNYQNAKITIDNLNVNYDHGPWHHFLYQWPNTSNEKKIVFSCEDFFNHYVTRVIDGSWAIFKLFNENNLNLDVKKLPHMIEIRADQCKLQFIVNTFH